MVVWLAVFDADVKRYLFYVWYVMTQPIFLSKIEEQLDLSQPLPFFAKNFHFPLHLVENFIKACKGN